LRSWQAQATLDFLWVTRDWKHFLVYYLSDLTLAGAGISAVLLLAERFDGIGTWTRGQVLFMLGYALIARSILNTLFSYNVLCISRRVGRGQLDHTLIQPQPLWMALLTEGFAPFSDSAGLLLGIGLFAGSIRMLSLALSAGWVALLLVNLLASAVLVAAFLYLWSSLAFWAPRGAEEISSSALDLIEQLKSFPLDGMGPVLLGGLLTVVPSGFVAWYPCRCLLGLETAWWAGGITPLAAALLATLAGWVFRRGLDHYGRTGSQRYLSFGHRR
jgi:ABC-2 type transport system permease protein